MPRLRHMKIVFALEIFAHLGLSFIPHNLLIRCYVCYQNQLVTKRLQSHVDDLMILFYCFESIKQYIASIRISIMTWQFY